MFKKLTLIIFSITLLVPAAVSAGTVVNRPFQPGTNRHLLKGTSANWSGYAVEDSLTNPTTGSVTDVSGQWTVPSLVCGRQTAYSSIWVGIDGYSSQSVEQLGTEQDCSRGRAYYSAWYEMYPQYSHTVRLTIRPGDHMTAEVKYASTDHFVLTMTDLTTGIGFSTTQTGLNDARSSAEWIVEAPSSWFGVLPLANFNPITMTNSSATINGHTGTINDSSWQKDSLTMLNASGVPISTPTALSTDGSSFTVSR